MSAPEPSEHLYGGTSITMMDHNSHITNWYFKLIQCAVFSLKTY